MADIAFIAYDIYDISQNGLSWESGLALGADVVGAVVPFASGGGVAVRALMYADDAVDAVRATGNIVDSTCALDNAENVAQLGGKVSPDFVVTPKGEAIPVPNGAVGPVSTKAPGFQYTGVSGGKGMDKKVTS